MPTPMVKTAMSRNISSGILDHLSQFLTLNDFHSNCLQTKYNILSHDRKNFNSQSLVEDFAKRNWN